jgi:hypothetical protein
VAENEFTSVGSRRLSPVRARSSARGRLGKSGADMGRPGGDAEGSTPEVIGLRILTPWLRVTGRHEQTSRRDIP